MRVPPALAASASAAVLTLTVTAATPLATANGVHAKVSASKSEVGVLFGNDDDTHTCTATVVHSATHNTIVTAAHCITGTAQGVTFSPAYEDGNEPFGRWNVSKVYVDPGRQKGDPKADVAILTIEPQVRDGRKVDIESVTGAVPLGTAPKLKEPVRIMGYNEGAFDQALECRTRNFLTEGFPTFSCDGFSTGSSGSPWITERGGQSYISGVIGGYHNGGCTDRTSYSSPFDSRVLALVKRAETGDDGDDVAEPPSDNC